VIKNPLSAPPEANRAGMIRAVIALLLIVIGVDSASHGEYLLAGARFGFAVLAALLAYATLPGRRPPPRQLTIGLLGASISLWVATFFFPTL
jgi:hypothetical protein